ncbi:MAG: hypothetical protein M3Y12_03250, partial [Bacteroidota bacterium]|nr:hypothetical protein [Bacteroidota bacterium]
ASTAAQLWLAAQLSETAAFNASRIRFYHHPLLTNAAGQKLSKSQQLPVDTGVLGQMQGRQAVFQAVAELLQLPIEAAESLAALREAFHSMDLTGPREVPGEVPPTVLPA